MYSQKFDLKEQFAPKWTKHDFIRCYLHFFVQAEIFSC